MPSFDYMLSTENTTVVDVDIRSRRSIEKTAQSTGPCGRLENSFGKFIVHKTLDLFRSLSLSASQRPSGSRKECGCALRVHALRVLADRQRMLDDGCETVLAIPDFDISRFPKNVNCSLVHRRWRARAEG